MPQKRTPKGTPVGGQFATSPHDESDVSLDDPGPALRAEIAAWGAERERLEKAVTAAEHEARESADRLREVEADLAEHRRQGRIRAAAAASEWESVITGSVSDDKEGAPGECLAVSSSHPFVRQGGVADQVSADGRVYYRRREGVYGGWPDSMRFQADRALTDAEMRHAAQLIGYNYRATVRGENMGDPVRDTPYSFIMYADTTKTRSDDIGMALERFRQC